MAEWALLIMVCVVTAGTYAFNQRAYQSQSLLVWAGAAMVMTIGLIVYIVNKANQASQPWVDRYQQEASPYQSSDGSE